ncbi:MAG: signal peptidase II [Clostridiaceae bacterium]|nr:signal peptidase II [Clostridiaceae bacterium]
MGLAIVISLVIIVLDQLSKSWIINNLPLHESIPVINDFFSLFHIRNSGAAWGMLSNQNWGIYLLTAVSVVASLYIYYLIYINDIKPVRITLALILGGSIGNLIDRIRFNNVVDFLSFTFGDYHFPTFNIADSAIVIGAICLALYLIFRPDYLGKIRFTNRIVINSADKSELSSNEEFENDELEAEIKKKFDSADQINVKDEAADEQPEMKTEDE